MNTKNINGNIASTKKNKALRLVLCIVLSLVLVAIGFLGGYVFGLRSGGSPSYTLNWVKDMVRKHYYKDVPKDLLNDATLDKIFGYNGESSLLDDYSTYYTPEEYKEQKAYRAGNQEGFGLSFYEWNGETRIYRVQGNSPADLSGLRAGMSVLEYGKTQEDMVVYDSNAFNSFFNGLRSGEHFVIKAGESAESEGEYYTVYIASYKQNYVFYADTQTAYKFTGENADILTETQTWLSFLPMDTAYIRLDSFNGDAANQFKMALDVFQQAEKRRLVLDLRNNGGGRISVLCDIAQYLCNPEESEWNFPVTNVVYKGDKTSVYYAGKSRYTDYFTANSEITVLANCYTASASEALMGAMLDYGTIDYEDIFLSEINGEAKTYGKGIMQTTYENFLTGGAIKLTTASIHWPTSNKCIQDVGILPKDGAMPIFSDGYVDSKDGMLREIVSNYFD